MASEIIVEFPTPLTDKEKKMIYGYKGEVVRCKDCVYCKRFNDVWYAPKRDELLCTLYVEKYHTTENDYCSRGERK